MATKRYCKNKGSLRSVLLKNDFPVSIREKTLDSWISLTWIKTEIKVIELKPTAPLLAVQYYQRMILHVRESYLRAEPTNQVRREWIIPYSYLAIWNGILATLHLDMGPDQNSSSVSGNGERYIGFHCLPSTDKCISKWASLFIKDLNNLLLALFFC